MVHAGDSGGAHILMPLRWHMRPATELSDDPTILASLLANRSNNFKSLQRQGRVNGKQINLWATQTFPEPGPPERSYAWPWKIKKWRGATPVP